MEGFIWGVVGGLAALILKDIYGKSKQWIADFRSPIKQYKGQDGFIHTYYKKKRPWHKRTKVLSYEEIKKLNKN